MRSSLLLLAAPFLCRYAEAIAQCEGELRASPRSAALLTLKGLAQQASSDRSALSTFRQALAIAPTSLAALQAAAQLEFEARDPQARQTLIAVLRQAPGSRPARAMLATLLFEARDCRAALPHLAQLPPEPAIRWQQAVCLAELQQWASAATHFATLLKLHEHTPTRFNLALAQWHVKDYRSAIATLQAMPLDADALRLQAAAHEAAGEIPAAIALLQKAITAFPQDERFLVDLSALCMDHNAGALGIEVLEAGLRRLPSSASLRTLLGVMLVRAGRAEEGEAAFHAAEKVSPLGRIGLASLLMQLGRPADAAALLRPQLDTAAAVVTYVRAILQKNPTRAESDELLKLLRAEIQRDTRHAIAYALLGKVQAQRGEPAEAAQALAKAIELDPTDRASTYQLMTVYRSQGRAREAAALAERVRTLVDREKQAEQSRFELVRQN